MSIKVIGTGSHIPDEIITSLSLEETLKLPAGWIEQRTGIRERRYERKLDLLSMAVQAARKALNGEKSVDLVIIHSSSLERSFPSLASSLSNELNMKPLLAFDMVSGCTGFMQALLTSISILEKEKFSKALIVATEHLSKHIDPEDKDTAILFGDGAGAMLVERCPGEEFLLATEQGTSVGKEDALFLNAGENAYMKMQGQEVFRFAVRTMSSSIPYLLNNSRINISEIDHFIPHQSNARILEAINRNLGFRKEKIISNLSFLGNTGSASIPIAIDTAVRNRDLKNGDTVLLSSYGAGLSWSNMIVRWKSEEGVKSCVLESAFAGY